MLILCVCVQLLISFKSYCIVQKLEDNELLLFNYFSQKACILFASRTSVKIKTKISNQLNIVKLICLSRKSSGLV